MTTETTTTPTMLYESERLGFTLLREGLDEQFSMDLFNDPLCLRFIGKRDLISLDKAREWILSGPVKSYNDNGYAMYKVVIKATNTPIGICGFIKRRPGEHEEDINIGFAYLSDYRSQGYGYEAAKRTIEVECPRLKVHRVGANVALENQASKNLLKKLGFVFNKSITIPTFDQQLDVFALVLPQE
ncbi:hypothetical protein SAMD00019534_009820 [Acytostelium subglobosum LB1]|uniref:hypothetical protein n=1 Tax=Acytostelium subglobosum LB1 TaxID=1410327 RepID=UPI00064506C6|nr:hypothetical protein SAMD00019534_009820 [Acytostelium subglobosum LB1]GAM17807.1 hypothetical protein SAMD00019534_009820 [Acytostelium subglobosum LB1]|eukprot:XP_012758403.1 hypothetical protein SAMD00019534_009820 [Acytostelium subglobosum LB1]